MIELPEAVTIAAQMNETLRGKSIVEGSRGTSPHKFAFYSREAEEYVGILRGKSVGSSEARGNLIATALEPGYVLALGGGGERILFHESAATLPAKHQLGLSFDDGAHPTVSVQGWESRLLLSDAEAAAHPWVGRQAISPLSDAFTYDHFLSLVASVPTGDPRSVKFFAISEPGIWGLGNGCLQDVLFRARLHPRRRVLGLAPDELRAFYEATVETLRLAAAQGGRDSEHDLFGNVGGYRRILSSEAKGAPCPSCGTGIEKIQYLGGASYFCPRCQAQ